MKESSFLLQAAASIRLASRGKSLLLEVESVYPSKQGLNETHRDANAAVFLDDQWLVLGIKNRSPASLAHFLNLQLWLCCENIAKGQSSN